MILELEMHLEQNPPSHKKRKGQIHRLNNILNATGIHFKVIFFP